MSKFKKGDRVVIVKGPGVFPDGSGFVSNEYGVGMGGTVQGEGGGGCFSVKGDGVAYWQSIHENCLELENGKEFAPGDWSPGDWVRVTLEAEVDEDGDVRVGAFTYANIADLQEAYPGSVEKIERPIEEGWYMVRYAERPPFLMQRKQGVWYWPDGVEVLKQNSVTPLSERIELEQE